MYVLPLPPSLWGACLSLLDPACRAPCYACCLLALERLIAHLPQPASPCAQAATPCAIARGSCAIARGTARLRGGLFLDSWACDPSWSVSSTCAWSVYSTCAFVRASLLALGRLSCLPGAAFLSAVQAIAAASPSGHVCTLLRPGAAAAEALRACALFGHCRACASCLQGIVSALLTCATACSRSPRAGARPCEPVDTCVNHHAVLLLALLGQSRQAHHTFPWPFLFLAWYLPVRLAFAAPCLAFACWACANTPVLPMP